MTFILLLCLLATIINLPFGFYRAGVRKFSCRWLLAVHLPVPLVIVARLTSGIGWGYVPVLIGFSVLGQFLGGMMRNRKPAPGALAGQTTRQVHVKEDEP